MYVFMYVCMYVRMYVCMYACMYVCMYIVCMYISTVHILFTNGCCCKEIRRLERRSIIALVEADRSSRSSKLSHRIWTSWGIFVGRNRKDKAAMEISFKGVLYHLVFKNCM